jgi:hypothetical protein
VDPGARAHRRLRARVSRGLAHPHTPGDSRADWRFALKEFPGGATHAVGHSSVQVSSIALPLLQGVTAPSPLPACPSLRGQPCREHQPFANTPAP